MTNEADYKRGGELNKTAEFFRNLIQGNFDRIFGEEEYRRFQKFLTEEAISARGFVISFPMTGNSLGWGLYELEEIVVKVGGNAVSTKAPQFFIPDGSRPSHREIPDDLKDYPVWSLNTVEEEK